MNPFSFEKATDALAAVQMAAAASAGKYLGGGTNLVDLMRENIERPDALIDVTSLSAEIDVREDGGVSIGAAAKNTAVASDPYIRRAFPMLSRAILAGASAQIRNMATVGGNLLQRTRCTYFYDDTARCNKREPGAGCDACEGFNRYHAILGASSSCVATHPSDMCVALTALEAVVQTRSSDGARRIQFADLHRLPGDRPDIEHDLKPGELITAVDVPPLPFASRSNYRKVRDRASYAFALVSVAAAIDVDEAGKIRDVRVALGGVAHKPWRALAAERTLIGHAASEAAFRAAAEAELSPAVGLRDNAFKIELAKRTIVSVLSELTGERS